MPVSTPSPQRTCSLRTGSSNATTLDPSFATHHPRLARKVQASLCWSSLLQVADSGDFFVRTGRRACIVCQRSRAFTCASRNPTSTFSEHALSQHTSGSHRNRTKWRDFSGIRTATLRPSPELVDAPISTCCSRPLRGPNVQQPGHVIVQPVAPACAMRRKDRVRMPCSSKSG